MYLPSELHFMSDTLLMISLKKDLVPCSIRAHALHISQKCTDSVVKKHSNQSEDLHLCHQDGCTSFGCFIQCCLIAACSTSFGLYGIWQCKFGDSFCQKRKLTEVWTSSKERACLSHKALRRISATRMEPLLLLKAKRLQ